MWGMPEDPAEKFSICWANAKKQDGGWTPCTEKAVSSLGLCQQHLDEFKNPRRKGVK